MKTFVKKTEKTGKKSIKNFVILKAVELIKIKGGEGTPTDKDFD